eukprot:scaffold6308_cov111-Isochrysis_galbana.AAC.7
MARTAHNSTPNGAAAHPRAPAPWPPCRAAAEAVCAGRAAARGPCSLSLLPRQTRPPRKRAAADRAPGRCPSGTSRTEAKRPPPPTARHPRQPHQPHSDGGATTDPRRPRPPQALPPPHGVSPIQRRRDGGGYAGAACAAHAGESAAGRLAGARRPAAKPPKGHWQAAQPTCPAASAPSHAEVSLGLPCAGETFSPKHAWCPPPLAFRRFNWLQP